MMNQPNYQEAAEPTLTRWHNPTKDTQTVKVLRYRGTHPKSRADWHETVAYVFKPGDTKDLPSEYDRAIHICDATNKTVILGGLAPLLVKVGSNETLSEGVDVELQALKEQEKQIAVAMLQKTAADMNLARAAAETPRPKQDQKK